uniref:Fungal lipase-type domain-containing protein n=1 Tax=viral metagenome TaxID=1070528 RepID=A0A6C0KYD0_9ZZZZ|tara:strand:- start:3006 stop:3791 length:786 start_codon:yes stop_codon:yes gene_type:complete
MKLTPLLAHTIVFDNLLYTSLNLSQAVYCNSTNWDCLTCSPQNIVETTYEAYGEKALLGYNNQLNTLFASFRGTSNIQNWIDDIQIEHHCIDKTNNICVEAGFYKLYEELSPFIFDEINKLSQKYKTNQLLLSGHSMGSTIASLFAYNLSKINYNITIITFGSPRVGNYEFVQDFCSTNITSLRITHYHDIVPHLPQYRLNYHHIPSEIWFNENNTDYKICNDSNLEERGECSNSCYPFSCTSTSDHLKYLNITFGSDGNC